MKKILVGLTALTMATSVMAGERTIVETRIGGSFAGSYKSQSIEGVKVLDSKTSGIGYEVAIEGMQEITDDFFLGLGVAYQNHAKNKNVLADVNGSGPVYKKKQLSKSVPLYLTAKYQFNTNTAFKPFVKANFGYSFNLKGDEVMKDKPGVENGLYYAVGAGIDYNNFVLDLAYQVNQGKLKSPYGKLKADHSRVTLGFGYRLNL